MRQVIAGVDEAGRGPLAGPVYAAAVIFEYDFTIAGLTDSKLLTPKKRDKLFDEICKHAVSFAIASASVEEIDQINILQASLLAMKRAVEQLSVVPTIALIDGNMAPKLTCEVRTIINGDFLESSISGASVLAKVARDRHLDELDKLYPGYGLSQHKGYGTKQHLDALKKHGVLPIHRRSFSPIKSLVETAPF